MAAKLLPLMRQTLTVRSPRVKVNDPTTGVAYSPGATLFGPVACSRQRVRKSYRSVQVQDGSSKDTPDAIIMLAFDARAFTNGLEFFVDEPNIPGFVTEQWFLQSPVIDSAGQGELMRLEVVSKKPV